MEECALKMEQPKKRQQITVQVKAELCIYKKNNPTATHEQLAAKFGISSRKTVTGILHDAEKWIKAGEEAEFDQSESQKKKLRGCEFPKLDNAVKLWYSQCRSNRIVPTDALIIEKALLFSRCLGINGPTDKKFAASDGWLYRFKQRHQIKSVKPHREPEPDTGVLPTSRNYLTTIAKDYRLEDVFRCDETSLFYRVIPRKTQPGDVGKGDSRLTVLLTCNASGTEKQKPVVIGTVGKPRGYRHVDVGTLPHVQYFHNDKAWTRGDIFKQYVMLLNRKFKEENRKCLLLLDHSSPRNVQGYEDQLTNLTVHQLQPPNTTFHREHPTDTGIVQSFKAKYKSRYIRWLLDDAEKTGNHPLDDNSKFTLRQAIGTIVDSWNDVSLGTIRGSFERTGVLTPVNGEDSQEHGDVDELSELLSRIPSHDVHRVMDVQEYLGVDEGVTAAVTLSDEDIIAEVCSVASQRDVEVKVEDDDEDEEDFDVDEETPVSWTQMKDAAKVLLKGLEQNAAVHGRAEQLHEELRHFVGFVGKVEKTALSAMIGQRNDTSFKENQHGAKLDRSRVAQMDDKQTCKNCIQVKGERDYLFRKLEEEVTKKLTDQDGVQSCKITGKCTDSGARCPHKEMFTEAICEIARLNQTILELTRREVADECVMPVHEFVEVTYGENEAGSPRESARPHVIAASQLADSNDTEQLLLVKKTKMADGHADEKAEEQPHLPVNNLICRWDESGESRSCGEVLKTVKDLTTHVAAHVTAGWPMIRECCWDGCTRNRHPYQFNASLMRHVNVHTGQVPYRCPRKGCGMMFTRYNQLKIHKRKHGRRRFVCKYPNCGMDFTSPSGLVVHVRRDHTGEKPYGCPFDGCGETFVTKTELNDHVRGHADEANDRKDVEEDVT